MSKEHISIILFAFLLLYIPNNALAADPNIIAEFTNVGTNPICRHIATDYGDVTHMTQAFDVTEPNKVVTEVLLLLESWHQSAGDVIMQLRQDSNGVPSSTIKKQILVPVDELLWYEPSWVQFLWPFDQNTPVSPGRWWITCSISQDANTGIAWVSKKGNPYNGGDDSLISKDDGQNWSTLSMLDSGFRVFGERVTETTTTTIAATPNDLPISGVASIDVTVVDSNGDPVQGPGTVTLSGGSAGTWGDSTLTLKDGHASTSWTAPDFPSHNSLKASFQNHRFARIDYYASESDNIAVSVEIVDHETTTTQSVSSDSINTYDSIDISVSVVDDGNNPITGGSVRFSCDPRRSGTFSSNHANVVDGNANMTWTAGPTAGTVTFDAIYSGFDAYTDVYGRSEDSDVVDVNYTQFNTTTTVRLSTTHPYITKGGTYAIVEVIDNTGNPVPKGTVLLSASSGWFPDSDEISFTGGFGAEEWLQDQILGPVDITANFEGSIVAGYEYLPSDGNAVATVIKDTDSTGMNLSCMSEWITDYNDFWLVDNIERTTYSPGILKDLHYMGDATRDFTYKLMSKLNWWGNREYSNLSAKEIHMMASSVGGIEDDRLDVHDFTWYGGHGGPDSISFTSRAYDNFLHHSEANDVWGDKDAEWVALFSCEVMAHDSDWAKTMNGLHLICGYTTVGATDSTEYSLGKAFAMALIQDGIYDVPHSIKQSWFIAGQFCGDYDVRLRQRVIGENDDMFADYIWSQGYVSDDPVVNSGHKIRDIDLVEPNYPIADANAGEPYVVKVGEILQLDASNSWHPDPAEYLLYVWDLDTETDTDDGDWDCVGGDGTADDADLWGRRPTVVFDTPDALLPIRLIVISEDWMANYYDTSVVINASGGGGASSFGGPLVIPMQSDSNDGLEIVDDFDSNNLPSEVAMPILQSMGTQTGYNEMANLAETFGMSGSAGLDEEGNWNMVDGDNELIVSRYSGSVMYLDKSRAFVFSGDPCGLPSEQQAIGAAQDFLIQNDIYCPNSVVGMITDVFASSGQKGSRTRLSRIPFQRRVNFRRQIEVLDKMYPVVGPGGGATVMMDENQDVVMFSKVWRPAQQGEVLLLYGASQAIAKFHELGSKALVIGSYVPPCKRIEIENVSLGYYEDGFLASQSQILPVYILDLTCDDHRGSQQAQVYMSALAAPLQAVVEEPNAPQEIDYGDSITFTGSAQGGTPPYTYSWASDVNGLLGNQPSDPNVTTSSLSVNYQAGSCTCEALPHTITLTVTDYYGYEATDSVNVTVNGLCSDFDHANSVNFEDFAGFALCWLAEAGQEDYDEDVDLTENGIVDERDLCVLTGEWLQ